MLLDVTQILLDQATCLLDPDNWPPQAANWLDLEKRLLGLAELALDLAKCLLGLTEFDLHFKIYTYLGLQDGHFSNNALIIFEIMALI